MHNKINYRKLYESHFGPIPKCDAEGRPFHIHHIDGNHSNNVIENLRLVTAREHYDLHRSQGDWAAALLLSHLTDSLEDLSKAATEMNYLRVANGSHPFLGGEVQHRRLRDGTHNFITESGRNIARKSQKSLLSNGKHNFQKVIDGNPMCKIAGRKGLDSQFTHGTHISYKPEVLSRKAKDRMTAGTHNFIGLNEHRINAGTHNFLQMWKCEYCEKEGKNLALYHRWHGEKCKNKGYR